VDRIGRRQPAAVEQPDARLGAEAAHAAATCVAERTQRAAIEKVSRATGQAAFDAGGRLRRHHVQQLEIGPGCVEICGLARRQQHAGTVFGDMGLAGEFHTAARRSLHDVNDVVIVIGAGLELTTLADRSSIHRQMFRAAKLLVANDPFQPGIDGFGFGGIRIDDGDVTDLGHGSCSSTRLCVLV